MSYAASGITGAAQGASAGAAAGPWGALIGGGVGLLGGILSEDEVQQKQQQALDAIDSARRAYESASAQMDAINNQWKAAQGSILDTSSRKDYRDLVRNADFEEAGRVDFDPGAYNVDDYYAQNKDSLVQGAINSAQGTAAAQGAGWGSGAAGQVASAAAEKLEGLANDAYGRMTAQRDFDYRLAADTANRKLEALQSQLGILGQAYQADSQTTGDYYANRMGILQNRANNLAAADIAKAGILAG